MSWKPNPRINSIIEKALEEGLKDSVEVLKDKIETNAPVDTGKLKKNIKVESSDNGLTQTVKVNVPYAQAVEYGTKHSAANPFMRYSVKESKSKMLKQFKGKLNK